MKYKIIEMNEGKITFTKEELEKLLEEAYNDGYKDGSTKIAQPQLWKPEKKEFDTTPYCLDSFIYNGKPSEAKYRSTSAGEEK